MTFVYGATLQSCMEYVAVGLLQEGAKPIEDTDGTVLYSLMRLSVPVAKALRAAVEATVPSAASGMKYLQGLARRAAEPLRWITPVGMPVVNYSEGQILRQVRIRSMGVTQVTFKQSDGQYDRRAATSAIAPNFVHSMDASHLCMVLGACPFDVLPIHDSFGCLPNHVSAMRERLLSTFVELYQHDVLSQFRDLPASPGKVLPQEPEKGTLNIRDVLQSRFAFC